MFGEGALTFREFVMREPLPLATIQDAVLEFLRGRDDAVLFGAQAVNAYVDEPRMTQDVDILSPRAEQFAEELREYLTSRFHIVVRVREVADGRGYRLFQLQKPKNRHLVDVRSVESLPPAQAIRRSPRGGTSRADRQQGNGLSQTPRQAEVRNRLARPGFVTTDLSGIQARFRAGG